MKSKLLLLAMGLALSLPMSLTPSQAQTNQSTLTAVLQKGHLQCGVHDGLPGFAYPDTQGNYSGMDVSLCRAVAAAVLGDANGVHYTPLKPAKMQSALQSGEVDLLASGSWSRVNDTLIGTAFAGPMYHDQIGFMLRRNLGVNTALQISGAAICLVKGDASEAIIADYFRANNMDYSVVTSDTFLAAESAFTQGYCDVLAMNFSALASLNTTLPNPGDVIILPERIGFTMLGPQVRSNDEQWADIVKWTRNLLIRAEELGLSSANVEDMRTSQNPEIQRILTSDGPNLGLRQNSNWGYNIIRQIGNYGEIFDRNIGPDTPISLARGINATISQGGLMVSPNF